MSPTVASESAPDAAHDVQAGPALLGANTSASISLIDDDQPTSDRMWATDPTAPRRVSRACCSCRSHKIKCNGERPCGGCLKKFNGLAFDKCIDGCMPCRRARTQCDGGTPCARCVETEVECLEEPSGPPISTEHTFRPASSTGRSKGIERAKLACLACRRDNKKCDDRRPCTRCLARSEECIHVARGPKIVKLRCKLCRQENRKCEDERPCKYCVDAGEACADVPRKGRGHGTRVKAACVHCRRDKIQCGTERPCTGCQRRGFECVDRTCSCTDDGPGRECAICRAQKANEQAYARGQGQDGGAEAQRASMGMGSLSALSVNANGLQRLAELSGIMNAPSSSAGPPPFSLPDYPALFPGLGSPAVPVYGPVAYPQPHVRVPAPYQHVIDPNIEDAPAKEPALAKP